jgi:hypothetical protein
VNILFFVKAFFWSVDTTLNSKDAEQQIEALASDKRIYHGF